MARTVSVNDLQLHPEAHRVPMMPPVQFADFVQDVAARGVRVPLEVQPGTSVVLDGRCRLAAAKENGLSQVLVVDASVNGDDPVIYMIRAASQRRHLTDDQRAMLAEEERGYLAEKGKASRKEKLKRDAGPGRGKKTVGHNASPTVSEGAPPIPRAKEQAARAHNVPRRKVEQAAKVKKADPALAEKVKTGDVPLAQAVRQVDREEKRQQLAEKAKVADEQARGMASAGEQPWRLLHGDCQTHLSSIERPRLIFADPPYNIGLDYGEGVKADLLPDKAYAEWCVSWICKCVRKLADDGSLWLLINDEWAAEFGVILKMNAKLTIRAWVKWYETFGVNCTNNFNRCSRHLFYCVKDPKRFVFHRDAVCRPSDRQTKYDDKRADPGGKIWDDVWQIPRLVGTAAERIPDFPTQLPLALVEPIVLCCSDPGDTVLDPFSGSATTGIAAVRNGRRYIGIEKSKKFCDLATLRLKGVGCGT